jgi:hypothetical protein
MNYHNAIYEEVFFASLQLSDTFYKLDGIPPFFEIQMQPSFGFFRRFLAHMKKKTLWKILFDTDT